MGAVYGSRQKAKKFFEFECFDHFLNKKIKNLSMVRLSDPSEALEKDNDLEQVFGPTLEWAKKIGRIRWTENTKEASTVVKDEKKSNDKVMKRLKMFHKSSNGIFAADS